MKPQVIRNQIVTDDLCHLIRSFELKAIEYGSVITDSNKIQEKPFTHLYRLNYVAEGHVFYTCCGKTIRIESNTLVYLPPQAILEVDEDEEQVTIFFINFEVGNLNVRQQFNNFMAETFPQFHVHDKDNRLRKLFNFLFDEGNKREIGYCMSMQGIFYNILMSMIRFSNAYHSPNKEREHISGSIGYFNEAIQYINRNISNNIRISDLANAIGISEIYLYKIFMKHAQKSPQQLLLAYRIQLAKNYLRNPGLSIKTIASELGFSNPNHFSTLFKKITGLPPKEYRNSLTDAQHVFKLEQSKDCCSDSNCKCN